MSIYRGGNIKTDSLIFGYDADIKSSRFYKGEPTTNIYLGPDYKGEYITNVFDGWGNYGWFDSNLYSIVDNSDQPFIDSDVQSIKRAVSNVYQSDMLEYTNILRRYFNGIFVDNTKNLSFYYYGTYGTTIDISCESIGSILLSSPDAIYNNNTQNITIPVIENKWQRISFNITGYSYPLSLFYDGWIILHSNDTETILDNTHYWKITAPQVEDKPYATEYTSYKRDYSDALIDLSTKRNKIDLTNVSFSSDNSGAIYFDGVNDYITSDINFIDRTDSPHSCCALIKIEYVVGLYSIWSFGQYNDYQYSTGLAIYDLELCWLSDGYQGTKVLSGIFIPQNEWVWVGFSRVGDTNNFYINGELKSTIISTPSSQTIISPNKLTIGMSSSNATQGGYFVGYIQLLYLYDQILSDDDMFNNFNSVKKRYSL